MFGNTTMHRWHDRVGKRMGRHLYVHRQYAHLVIPSHLLVPAIETLQRLEPGFVFNCLRWQIGTRFFRFDEASDFDQVREPHVGTMIYLRSNGLITLTARSQAIWHHKWLWVTDDYTGFDVQASKAWSHNWMAKFGERAKGSDRSFDKQLAKYKVIQSTVFAH